MASPCRAGVPYELVGMEHVSVLDGTQAPGPLFFPTSWAWGSLYGSLLVNQMMGNTHATLSGRSGPAGIVRGCPMLNCMHDRHGVCDYIRWCPSPAGAFVFPCLVTDP